MPSFSFANVPIAAPITEAFHVKMNIAPAPKNNEKNRQNSITLMLFMNILNKIPELTSKFPDIFEFIVFMVVNWAVNNDWAVSSGNAMNHIE